MGAGGELDGGPGHYLRSISDFWHLSLPEHLELMLTSRPVLLRMYKLFRLFWVLITLPPFTLLATLKLPGVPSRPSWTRMQRLFYPMLNKTYWMHSGLGPPPIQTYAQARAIPILSWFLHSYLTRKGGRGVGIELKDLPVPHQDRQKRWFLSHVDGGVLDPNGVVPLEAVPCFSMWRTPLLPESGTAFEKAKPGEKAVMYLIGGGYIEGTPIEERVWTVCRKTGLRVFSPNFRKASRPERAFPAAVLDALTAYAYLVEELGFKDISLMGDSAGGGLCLAVMQVLARLPLAQEEPAVTPSHVVVHSPFTDLINVDFESVAENQDVDLLNRGMLAQASFAYGQNLLQNPLPEHSPAMSSPWHPTQLRRHPFISPSLPSSTPSLRRCLQTARVGGPKIFLTYGSAELLADQDRELRERLREAGWGEESVEVMEGTDEIHVWAVFPTQVSPSAKAYWLRLMRFLEMKKQARL